jgi:PTH1 family peptidyl-tRNA hydrolase
MRKKQKLPKNNSRGEDPSPDSHPESNPGLSPGRGSGSTPRTLCIIGLGNPGGEYAGTRHNVGFWLLDAIAERLHIRFRRRLFTQFAMARISSSRIAAVLNLSNADGGERDFAFDQIVLVKPLTFMNRSGKVIPHLLRLFGHQVRFAVAADQLDLEPGVTRVKRRGGTAGHNGLKSVSAYLDRDFWPLYIGIGRPGEQSDVISHVLGIPGDGERALLDAGIRRLADWAPRLAFEEIDALLSEINARNSFPEPTGIEPHNKDTDRNTLNAGA